MKMNLCIKSRLQRNGLHWSAQSPDLNQTPLRMNWSQRARPSCIHDQHLVEGIDFDNKCPHSFGHVVYLGSWHDISNRTALSCVVTCYNTIINKCIFINYLTKRF